MIPASESDAPWTQILGGCYEHRRRVQENDHEGVNKIVYDQHQPARKPLPRGEKEEKKMTAFLRWKLTIARWSAVKDSCFFCESWVCSQWSIRKQFPTPFLVSLSFFLSSPSKQFILDGIRWSKMLGQNVKREEGKGAINSWMKTSRCDLFILNLFFTQFFFPFHCR